ncbi:TPA: hypothetical protein ACQM9X_001307 [Streptococcus pyogenes]
MEFKDEWKSAADHLNDFIDKNKYAKVTVVGYQVVQLSPYGREGFSPQNKKTSTRNAPLVKFKLK